MLNKGEDNDIVLYLQIGSPQAFIIIAFIL